jgi:hypothetical protein
MAEEVAVAEFRAAEADDVTVIYPRCFRIYAVQPNLLPLGRSEPCCAQELLWLITVLLDLVLRDECMLEEFIPDLLVDHA